MSNCKYCKADCIFRGEDIEKDCRGYIPMTNADRIRAMTDEEIADTVCCLGCPESNCVIGCERVSTCRDCWIEWLQQPVKEDAG